MISLASIIARMFASATPLALGGVGGLFGEKSGVVNIGLEGTMLFGAFAAVVGSYYTGNPWIGLLCGAITGILVSALHAFLCITLKIENTIVGLAINILASNATIYLCYLIFGVKSYSASVEKLPAVSVPWLKDIPGVSAIFSDISVLTLLMFIITAVAYYLLYKTKFGLHVVSAGESPRAAYVMGVNVAKTRYIAVMIGGFTCGLAGAFMSISYLSNYVRDMISGRGFIAIAAILFGRYNPVGVLLAALFFGLADAVQMSLQGTVTLSSDLIQCIPYLLTILAVTFNEWRELKKSKRISAI